MAKPLNPAAISAEDLAGLLTKAGGRQVTAEQIAADIQAGAPTNPDGSLHLVQFCAWLTSQVK